MAKKRGWILLVVAALAVAALVVLFLRQARDGVGPTAPSRAAPPPSSRGPRVELPARSADRAPSSVVASAPEDASVHIQPSLAALPDEGTIKEDDQGRTYVEYVRDDGTRVRDYRRAAPSRLKSDRPPSPMAQENALAMRRDLRPPVWACMKEHWDALRAVPGAGESPTVIVYAAHGNNASEMLITRVRSVVAGQPAPDGAARCIEGALVGARVPVEAGIEQSAYEDFEVGMRFRLPVAPKPKVRGSSEAP